MVVVLLFCIAMYYDHRYYRVPNWVVFTGFALGLLKQIDLYGWKGIFIYSISIILTGLILSPLFLLRMFGAGDIKLFIMVSGMHGIQFSIKYFVIALFIGAIYSVGKMYTIDIIRVTLIYELDNNRFRYDIDFENVGTAMYSFKKDYVTIICDKKLSNTERYNLFFGWAFCS